MTQVDIRVAIAGARGKMGTTTIAALRSSSGVTYVGGVVRSGASPADAEFDDVRRLIEDARPHVLVDFTHFPASKDIALTAIDAGVRPVIGTSGYGAQDIDQLRIACSRSGVGCVFAPNFAIGAVLMMKFSAEAARHFNDVEIVEMHEAGKKDAPSGTAMATARRLALERADAKLAPFDRPSTVLVKADGARGAELEGIGIHSLRLPGVVSHQEVVFGAAGETLRIAHDSASRASFMTGVLIAVRAARDLTHFVDGLEQLL